MKSIYIIFFLAFSIHLKAQEVIKVKREDNRFLFYQLQKKNDTIIKNALYISLNSGRYKIEAKDNQGNIKCEGTLKFRSGSLGGTSRMGGQATASSGKTVVTNLFY